MEGLSKANFTQEEKKEFVELLLKSYKRVYFNSKEATEKLSKIKKYSKFIGIDLPRSLLEDATLQFDNPDPQDFQIKAKQDTDYEDVAELARSLINSTNFKLEWLNQNTIEPKEWVTQGQYALAFWPIYTELIRQLTQKRIDLSFLSSDKRVKTFYTVHNPTYKKESHNGKRKGKKGKKGRGKKGGLGNAVNEAYRGGARPWQKGKRRYDNRNKDSRGRQDSRKPSHDKRDRRDQRNQRDQRDKKQDLTKIYETILKNTRSEGSDWVRMQKLIELLLINRTGSKTESEYEKKIEDLKPFLSKKTSEFKPITYKDKSGKEHTGPPRRDVMIKEMREDLNNEMTDNFNKMFTINADFEEKYSEIQLRKIDGTVKDIVHKDDIRDYPLTKLPIRTDNKDALRNLLEKYGTEIYRPININLLKYGDRKEEKSELTPEILSEIRNQVIRGLYEYYLEAHKEAKRLLERFATTFGITLDLTKKPENNRNKRTPRNGNRNTGNRNNFNNTNTPNNGAYRGKAPPLNVPEERPNRANNRANNEPNIPSNVRNRLERIKKLMGKYPEGTEKREKLDKMYFDIMNKLKNKNNNKNANLY